VNNRALPVDAGAVAQRLDIGSSTPGRGLDPALVAGGRRSTRPAAVEDQRTTAAARRFPSTSVRCRRHLSFSLLRSCTIPSAGARSRLRAVGRRTNQSRHRVGLFGSCRRSGATGAGSTDLVRRGSRRGHAGFRIGYADGRPTRAHGKLPLSRRHRMPEAAPAVEIRLHSSSIGRLHDSTKSNEGLRALRHELSAAPNASWGRRQILPGP